MTSAMTALLDDKCDENSTLEDCIRILKEQCDEIYSQRSAIKQELKYEKRKFQDNEKQLKEKIEALEMKLEIASMQEQRSIVENKDLKEQKEKFSKAITQMEKKLGVTEQKLEQSDGEKNQLTKQLTLS